MTATAWIREFGLMLGWRERAKASRIRVGAAGVAGTMPASETISAQGDRLPVLAGRTLIARLEVDSLIAGIRAHSHASAENFQRHYAPVIDRALEFAQLLPASESHHHAQPGGMALHSLETALHALKRRQGRMLPPGVPTETQQRAQHRWTYAVFLAALLHDMGKAAHDLRVAYDSAAQANAVWNPLVGSLLELGATSYRVDFAHTATRSYAAHRRFPLVLLPKFVQAPVLGWLAEEGTLLQELSDYLCGERHDGALAELVGAGDRESVRRNLLTGPRQRFASARTAPLIERLMEALRRMLAEGAWLPLNRDGAAGWVAEDAVWFVSKRLADEVRRFLQAQGDHAVPGEDKNDRLFDVWQEYGALIPNPATGGAVWRARVEGADYAHELTLLRFPLSRLYPEATRFPAAMQGRIVVLPALNPVHTTDAAALAQERDSPPPAANGDPPVPSSLTAARAASNLLDPTDDAATLEPCPSSSSSLRSPVRPAIGPLPALREAPAQQHPALAMAFMAWVQRGVAGGSLAYNESGALVHFVAEGLFLVSPGLFRAYADAHPAEPNAELGNAKEWPGKAVQKAVCGAGWNRKGPRNTSVLRYRVVSREGKPGKTLNGVVVLQPERYFAPVPPANPHLQPAPAQSIKGRG
jgi:integrating conjugative element relaxase (TIGR03760 family)